MRKNKHNGGQRVSIAEWQKENVRRICERTLAEKVSFAGGYPQSWQCQYP